MGVPEIARLFETTLVTVRFWIKRFNCAGPPGLYDDPRSGRPSKVVDTVKRTVNELLQDDPQKEGYLATFWTVAMLLIVIAQKFTLTLSPSTLRNTLHFLGFRCGHATRSNRPNQATFRCVKCGYRQNADANAARNIAAQGPMAFGQGRPDTARSQDQTENELTLFVSRSRPDRVKECASAHSDSNLASPPCGTPRL
jgi:transposase